MWSRDGEEEEDSFASLKCFELAIVVGNTVYL